MSPIPSSSCRQPKRFPAGVVLLIAAIVVGAFIARRRIRAAQAPAPDPAGTGPGGMRFEVHTVDMATPGPEVTA